MELQRKKKVKYSIHVSGKHIQADVWGPGTEIRRVFTIPQKGLWKWMTNWDSNDLTDWDRLPEIRAKALKWAEDTAKLMESSK